MRKTGHTTSKFNEHLSGKLFNEKEAVNKAATDVSRHAQSLLKKLGEDLGSVSGSVLNSISENMEARLHQHYDEMNKISDTISKIEQRQSKWWVWTSCGCIGIALLSGLTIYGLTSWHRSELIALAVERDSIKTEIEILKQSRAKVDDWGVQLISQNGERFIVLPEGKRWIHGDWTMGNRKAAKIGE